MGKRFNRKRGIKKQYSHIYIFAEGKKTEPIYFEIKKKEIEEAIRRKNIKIEINKGNYGGGYNTKSLIDFALDFIKTEKIDLKKDECWVVFDKDDFNRNFNNAINKAEKNGLKVAYSNEAFELWFLLHFDPMESAIGRKDYNNKLTENYKKITGDKKYKYDKVKSVLPLVGLIKNKELCAIKNAKKLLTKFKEERSFLKKNPSTTVHILVERLNKLNK